MKTVLKYLLLCVSLPIILAALFLLIIFAGNTIETVLYRTKIIEPPELEQTHVLKTMPKYDDGDVWENGFWQDFIVYGEYKFSGTEGYFESEGNTLFKPVDEEMLKKFNVFYPRYKEWLDNTDSAHELLEDDLTKVYRFKRSCVDGSDWYYYEGDYDDGEDENCLLFGCHTYYFFDTQSQTLYLLNYHT